MWIGQQPPSLGRVVLLLATTQIYKHGVYEPRCLAISWCTISPRFATWVLPASIRIHYLKNFDSELQLINASLVLLPVSFSGRGEKLLERNKHPGHNLRQYGRFKTKILNLRRSRDWSLLQKVRKRGACSSYSYSEMTQLASSSIKFNSYFWLIPAFTYLPKVGINLYKSAS